MAGVLKIVEIITAVICGHAALLAFIVNIIPVVSRVIILLYQVLCFLIVGFASFGISNLFGFAANPIGQPLFLFFLSGVFLGPFKKTGNLSYYGDIMCNSDYMKISTAYGWDNCWYDIAMILAWVWSMVLLIINIIFLVTKKESISEGGAVKAEAGEQAEA